ncbi:MAG: flagellar export chaperone FliS [Chthoniobacteraceae bacterium]
MKHKNCALAYRANSINTASPGRLILMLFDGALRFMNTAISGFEDPNVITRNTTIHNNLLKTQAIFCELQASLDPAHDPAFCQRMHDLYDFMRDQLRKANLQKSVEPIGIVIELLTSIRDAWAEMLAQTEVAASAA